jgi:hypothetical protein
MGNVSSVDQLRGPTGMTGTMGPIGLTGTRGPIGLTGTRGPVGLTGTMGPIGLTGTMGPFGLTGTMGPIGLTGTMGPLGLTGTMGPIGLTGTMGPIGILEGQTPTNLMSRVMWCADGICRVPQNTRQYFTSEANCAGMAAQLKREPNNTMTFGVADTGLYIAYKDAAGQVRQIRLQGEISDNCSEQLTLGPWRIQPDVGALRFHQGGDQRFVMHGGNQGDWTDAAWSRNQGRLVGDSRPGNFVRYEDGIAIRSGRNNNMGLVQGSDATNVGAWEQLRIVRR